MPGAKHAPANGQDSTTFTMRDIAGFCDMEVIDLDRRMKALASSQELSIQPDWFDSAEFVLADRDQVENPQWCRQQDPKVVVSCVGHRTLPYSYGFEPSVTKAEVAVCHHGTRDATLNLCIHDIVAALSQGRSVVVHCNQSFHRGPCGLIAILKVIFDIPAHCSKSMIVALRTVWNGYMGEMRRGGDSLVLAYHWAAKLRMWNPPPKRQARGQWGTPSLLTRAQAFEARLAADEEKYFYRAMTADLVEFDARVPASSQAKHGMQLAHSVLEAISKGSHFVSPFLHFSRKFMQAQQWKRWGESFRGEEDTLMCRIPKSALSQVHNLDNPLRIGEFLDMSDQSTSTPLIAPYHLADKTDRIERLLGAVGHGHTVKEVLVAWRGSVPRSLFQVVHGGTGEFIRMLDPMVPLLTSSHCWQTFVEAINPSVVKSSCCQCFCGYANFHFTVKSLFVILSVPSFALVLSMHLFCLICLSLCHSWNRDLCFCWHKWMSQEKHDSNKSTQQITSEYKSKCFRR